MFVSVEGIEGSGKSTLLAALAERLRAAGRPVFVTREPGGTPAGDAIRAIFLDPAIAIGPLTEALLVNAARAQHVSDVIRPELSAGRIVLCDRYVDSTMAYQGYGRGVDRSFLRGLCDTATGRLEPDLIFLIDVPVDVSRARGGACGAAGDRVEIENDAFHERVRQGFLDIARTPRHRVLDGTRSPEELLDVAAAELERRMHRIVT
jgi:dTMP kinase